MNSAQPENSIVSINPATGEAIGSVRNASAQDVHDAVARARRAHPGWAELSFRARGAYILAARRRILETIDDIARLISTESGKTVTEALSAEVMPALTLMAHFAGEAERLLRRRAVPLGNYNALGRCSAITHRPLGVIGIISPWNFPFTIPLGDVVMALMAGNTAVLKPSEHTPLTGVRIGEIFSAAGLPDGVLTVVSGDGAAGAALAGAKIERVLFTGSVATGRKVMAAAAANLVPATMELGGKDPMIVCRDADLDVASSGAVWGAFMNSGQLCASVERCYVHGSVAEKFLSLVVEKAKKLRQGDPLDPDTDIGAMANERQLQLVEAHVDDAVAKGATVLCGGARTRGTPGLFFPPTVLTGVDHTFRIMTEETFGPVLPVMTFKDEDEAVRLANDSLYGLTASVWTRDIARGCALAQRLEAGTVNVNECVYTAALCQTPWGGVKESGVGRTHGAWGLMDLVEPVHIHVNYLPQIKDFWWYGYSGELVAVLKRLCRTFTEPGVGALVRSMPAFLQGMLRRRH